MAVPEGNLVDELLPEIDMSVTPSKLTETVRVDLYRFDSRFLHFLVINDLIEGDEDGGIDTVVIPVTKFPKFCQSIRDAYRRYQVKNAHV